MTCYYTSVMNQEPKCIFIGLKTPKSIHNFKKKETELQLVAVALFAFLGIITILIALPG